MTSHFQRGSLLFRILINLSDYIQTNYRGRDTCLCLRWYFCQLLNIANVSSDTECLAIEENLRKTKWLLICSHNPHENNIWNHLMNLNNIIDRNSSRYYKCDRAFKSGLSKIYLVHSWIVFLKHFCIGVFNSEISETKLRNFCNLY